MQGTSQKRPVQSSVEWLANSLAAMGTFLTAPYLYSLTSPFVETAIRQNYGREWVDIGLIAFALVGGMACFFGLRLSIFLALTAIVAAAGRYGLMPAFA